MPFFGSKGNECWICHRKTTPEGQFLDPEELHAIFNDVFEEFDASELKDHCLCAVCAGILKYTAQDSVAARIKIEETSEAVRAKLGSAKSRLKDRISQYREKEEEE